MLSTALRPPLPAASTPQHHNSTNMAGVTLYGRAATTSVSKEIFLGLFLGLGAGLAWKVVWSLPVPSHICLSSAIAAQSPHSSECSRDLPSFCLGIHLGVEEIGGRDCCLLTRSLSWWSPGLVPRNPIFRGLGDGCNSVVPYPGTCYPSAWTPPIGFAVDEIAAFR